MNLKSKFKSGALTTFAICLVVLFPLYRIIWNSYALIILALVLVFQNFSDQNSRRALKERFSANKMVFLKTTLIFFPFFLSLLYSENIQSGMGAIERMLPIIVFPFLIFFFVDHISKKQLGKILMVFLIACLVHSMYLNFEFLRLGLFENFQGATFYDLPFREAVMNLNFAPLHPTYVSLWYCFAIAIALSKFRAFKNHFLKIACAVAMFILLITIVLLSSRIGFLCLAAIGILYIFSVRNTKIRVGLLLLFIGISLFSITKISLISSRLIAEFQQTELVPPVGKEHNSINIRIGIYKCAVNLIKQHVWLGVGIGDVQHELDTCYLNYQTDVYQSDNYNTHNFFLHSFLVAGFLAFLALVFMIWFFFDIGFRQKSILYISFMLIIFLGMLFENVLSRNHGIIFFGIFNTLFIQYYLLNPKYVDRGYSSLQQ